MSLSLTCPHCSRRLGIKDPSSGKPVKCPRCAGLVRVPLAPTADAWWQDQQETPRREYGASLKVVEPRWHHRPEVRLLGAGVAVALLLAVGVGGAVWFTQPEPQPVVIAEPEPPVELALAKLDERTVEEPLPAPPIEIAARLAPLVEEVPVPEPEPVVAAPPQPVEPQRFLVKRRQFQGDEDLRRQLLSIQELTLEGPVAAKGKPSNAVGGGPVGNHLLSQGGNPKIGQMVHFTPAFLGQRQDLHGLPFRMGNECQLGKEPAEDMQALSRQMRNIMAESSKNDRGDARTDPKVLADKINAIYVKIDFHKESAVPCLMQMLQPESTSVRKVLVDQLAGIKKPRSTEGLVKLALFDLSDSIREEAVQALARRPREEYRQQLLAGLRYPLPAVADHAAEALVALNDKPSIPALRELADQPDPSEATYDNNHKAWMVPEVVRINHLGNCLMCHAPSKSTTDLVRGRVPSANQPLPPPVQYYEDNSPGPFVRADITYLRQDFSVFQPVDRPGHWPTMQRFDYLVRTRYESVQEFYARQKKDAKASYPQREAVLFALKELSK